MGAKTKIDWCDSTWNPVTGCRHGCDYCYARGIAKRFGGNEDSELHTLETRQYKGGTWTADPYPFGFAPTLHKYLLHVPLQWKKTRTIFVCSMADLFGDWVPLEWIQEVFRICREAPQHRYLFLTKNPMRYISLMEHGQLPTEDNFWYGSTATKPETPFFFCKSVNTFVSIEPIQAPFTNLGDMGSYADWVIVGAETGRHRGKTSPERQWIEEIAEKTKARGTPLFMKESLRDLMGADFRQEFPWETDDITQPTN